MRQLAIEPVDLYECRGMEKRAEKEREETKVYGPANLLFWE